MKITFFERMGHTHHAAIRARLESVATKLMGTRMRNTLKIRVEMRQTTLPKDHLAHVAVAAIGSKAQKSFTIRFDRRRPLDEMLRNAAHEMRHIEQFASGRLQYRYWRTDRKLHARWDGAELGPVDHIPYAQRPWEVEARASEVLK